MIEHINIEFHLLLLPFFCHLDEAIGYATQEQEGFILVCL